MVITRSGKAVSVTSYTPALAVGLMENLRVPTAGPKPRVSDASSAHIQLLSIVPIGHPALNGAQLHTVRHVALGAALAGVLGIDVVPVRVELRLGVDGFTI